MPTPFQDRRIGQRRQVHVLERSRREFLERCQLAIPTHEHGGHPVSVPAWPRVSRLDPGAMGPDRQERGSGSLPAESVRNPPGVSMVNGDRKLTLTCSLLGGRWWFRTTDLRLVRALPGRSSTCANTHRPRSEQHQGSNGCCPFPSGRISCAYFLLNLLLRSDPTSCQGRSRPQQHCRRGDLNTHGLTRRRSGGIAHHIYGGLMALDDASGGAAMRVASLAVVPVVPTEPGGLDPRLVSPSRCPVEPLVHAPERVHAPRVG